MVASPVSPSRAQGGPTIRLASRDPPCPAPSIVPVGSVTQSSALPERLDAHIDRIVAQGAAPIPLVPLNTTVPTRGPIVLHGSGAFELLVYCGPLMRTTLQPTLGSQLDTYA